MSARPSPVCVCVCAGVWRRLPRWRVRTSAFSVGVITGNGCPGQLVRFECPGPYALPSGPPDTPAPPSPSGDLNALAHGCLGQHVRFKCPGQYVQYTCLFCGHNHFWHHSRCSRLYTVWHLFLYITILNLLVPLHMLSAHAGVITCNVLRTCITAHAYCT